MWALLFSVRPSIELYIMLFIFRKYVRIMQIKTTRTSSPLSRTLEEPPTPGDTSDSRGPHAVRVSCVDSDRRSALPHWPSPAIWHPERSSQCYRNGKNKFFVLHKTNTRPILHKNWRGRLTFWHCSAAAQSYSRPLDWPPSCAIRSVGPSA